MLRSIIDVRGSGKSIKDFFVISGIGILLL